MSTISKLFLVSLVIVVSLVSCSQNSNSTSGEIHRNNQAETVVRKMYVALSSGDQDAYMDTILPANRHVLNPMNLVPALSIGGNLGGLGIGIDLDKLMKFSVRDLKLETLKSAPGYALVQARGTVRYPTLGMELEFCDQHDVREENGHWYVDIYAPERQERVSKLLEERQKKLLNHPATPSGNTDDPLGMIFAGIGQGMQQALNLCEP